MKNGSPRYHDGIMSFQYDEILPHIKWLSQKMFVIFIENVLPFRTTLAFFWRWSHTCSSMDSLKRPMVCFKPSTWKMRKVMGIVGIFFFLTFLYNTALISLVLVLKTMENFEFRLLVNYYYYLVWKIRWLRNYYDDSSPSKNIVCREL